MGQLRDPLERFRRYFRSSVPEPLMRSPTDIDNLTDELDAMWATTKQFRLEGNIA